MWIIQIIVGIFWLLIGLQLIFQESLVWHMVEDIAWFKRRYHSATTYQWKRFCQHNGVVCYITGCLLFLKLPLGLWIIGGMALALLIPMMWNWK